MSKIIGQEDECLLSTVDNPYNPFDDWDSWLAYDMMKGYNCCSYVSRVLDTFDDNSYVFVDDNEKYEMAIDEILRNDVVGLYIKVNKVVPVLEVEEE